MSVLTHPYDAAAPPGWLAGRDCPLCGRPGRSLGERDGYRLRECCGILLSWHWPDEETYHRFYTEGNRYPCDQQRLERLGTLWERDSESLAAAELRLTDLLEHCPGAVRLLDVGSGTGAFPAAAARRGLVAVGLEPNANLAAEARRLGRPVDTGSWTEAAGQWDVITLLDVLEHLTRPVECLHALRTRLAPGDTLVIEWPEWRCPAAMKAGIGWRHVRPLQHPCLYSDSAARRLFQGAELRVRSWHRPLAGSLGKITYCLEISSV